MCKAWLCDGKKELSTFHHDGGIVTYHDGGRGRGFEEIDYSDRVVGLVDAELTGRMTLIRCAKMAQGNRYSVAEFLTAKQVELRLNLGWKREATL